MPRFPGVFPTSAYSVLRGQQEVDPIASPAAGADWSYTLPGSYYRRLISFHGLLTTSATVANRQPAVRVSDGTNTLFLVRSTVNVTANTVLDFVVSTQFTLVNASVASGFGAFPFLNVWLPPGYTVQAITTALAADDQWSKLTFWWEIIDQAELQELHNHEARHGTHPALPALGGQH